MSVGPFAKLELWVGTERFDLLNNKESGFLIREWQPSIPVLKGGGTWADPSTADERELVDGKLTNVEDRFLGDISAYSEDSLIAFLRSMRAVLNAARQYTLTEWQGSPGYICAQGYRETNPRYTRIKNWRTLQDGFPYGPPQWENLVGSSVEDFELTIEHGAWTDTAPGVGTATELSAVETYDGRNLGNVDDAGVRVTTTTGVFVANHHTIANLTDIYVDDGGVWGANLLNAVIPYDLLPPVPAVNDAAYFGIDTTIANSGPFASLIFDISIAGTGYTATWEYWNGAFWNALVPQDNTDTAEPLDTLGINGVHFEQPVIWPTRNIALDGGPAITGYWVRVRVTAIPGALIAPTQQNSNVYTVPWGYVEIQEDDVGGDLPPLVRIKFNGEAGNKDLALSDLQCSRVVYGVRSISRGSLFTAYLNCADEQNSLGITVGVGAATAFATDLRAAAGRLARMTLGAPAALADRVTLDFSSALMPNYTGTYHVYIRGFTNNPTPSEVFAALRIQYASGAVLTEVFRTETVRFVSGLESELLDMGVINFQATSQFIDTDTVESLRWSLMAGADASTVTDFLDLILIPVDESASDFSITTTGNNVMIARDRYLDADSVGSPKHPTRSFLRNSSDQVVIPYLQIGGIQMIQANAQQRLWTLYAQYHTGAWFADPDIVCRIQIERQQRYWSMRGAG